MIIQSDSLVCSPLVSVVIATYNQKQYIEETIESVLKQECDFPFEIIVSDDGSDDGERELLRIIQGKYPEQIKLVFNDKNMMVTKNYFNSFMEARGKYIAPLDGDDIWNDKAKLSKQVKILEEKSDVSVVLTGFQKLYEENNKIETFDKWVSPLTSSFGLHQLPHVLEEHFTFFPVVSSVLFRTNDMQEYRVKAAEIIDGENVPGEGMPIFAHLALSGKYYFLSDITTVYRIRKSSLCHIEDIQRLERFKIKYAFQKISIAEFFAQKKCIRKCKLKLIALYLYAVDNKSDKFFLKELSELSKDISSVNVFDAVKRINYLSKHKLVSKALFVPFTIKNFIQKRV